MSGEVLFPVFVLARDCGEVTEYPSLMAMQYHMEAVDVENDEYDVWDAQGNGVRLAVRSPNPKSQWLHADRLETQLSEQDFASWKAKSKPCREPEPTETIVCSGVYSALYSVSSLYVASLWEARS